MPKRRIRTVLLAAAGTAAVAAAAATAVVAHAASTGCSVSYTVRSQWGTGFSANVAVTNVGDPVRGWTVRWSYPAGQTVTQAWGATVSQSGTAVTANSASWNGTLRTNRTASFGFNGTWNGSGNPTPTDFSLNGVLCTGQVAATTAPPSPSSSPSASLSPSPSSSPSPSPSSPTPSASSSDGCARQAAAGPVVKVTDVNVGVPVTGYGREGDTEPLPMAIAATPSGGSWLAWRGTDNRVYLGKLDCDDKLVGTPTSFEGIDLQDVQADANGGVLLLTRRGECGEGPLCGGSSSPCNTMHMIRFDNSGQQVWERQVTNLSDSLSGYDNGARFIWWYQHHGRLASDGKTFAAYFGVAITVQNGNCVDIHEGDRMQVVDANGTLVSNHRDSFQVGCSHSWTSRIAWDPRTSRYAMVCATDNACRIAQPNPYRTVAAGACDGTLFGGDLVLASKPGYWTAWSQGGQVRLEHFTTGASDTTITTAARSSHPHLVSYGASRMLLTWESGSSMAAQVYDASSGTTVGSQFTINVPDHSYQAFKPYADGSTAYPAAGTTNTSIRIARVMPLT
ncbi:cellulose-binding domain-containing protein [Micromonospora sp. CPCC 206061]|uniref:cellulose-binding domain-containing protein n=1 Tax=Micromonospora sp. CPCC 206061 TaxID=3122410 RepID=UPI002FF26188